MKRIFKTIKTTCLVAAVFFSATALFSRVQAQDPTDQIQEFSVKIDKLGDATWEVNTKMTQAQWEGFKQGPLVNDPSITKRNMERSMSTYLIEDFKRDIDDMNRTVKMTFKVKAFAAYKGNGDWELKLDSKNPQITKLSDNSYMSTSNMSSGGQLIQQIYKVFFPPGAKDIQQTTDSFNKAMFTYKSGGGIGAWLTWNNILGFLLIVAAVLSYVMISKQKPAQQALNININKRITDNPTPAIESGGAPTEL